MIKSISYLAALCLSSGVFASSVIYTDGSYPVSAISPDIPIVYLDAPDRVQREIFGSLPTDPVQAEKQVHKLIASPIFKLQHVAYQGIMKAWSLGLEKYPAVVFDDQWVVYGTTDIDMATQQFTIWRETNQ
ncbi:TIGR03757 family integrating conjugative element protein [Yersinia enterocolitica]